MLPIVQLLPLIHRGNAQILIAFPNDAALNNAIRRLKGIKWSQTHKAWYLPLSEANYELVCACVQHLATIDVQQLRQYLQTRNTNSVHPPKDTVPQAITPLEEPSATVQRLPGINNPVPEAPLGPVTALNNMSTANRLSLEKAIQHLQLKAYSASTIKTYKSEMQLFFKLLGQHPADKLTTADVKRYLLKCIVEGISENTMHSRINALKFYYEQVLGREKFL
ncbi:MAG: phage integrase N-terminal SAM-like domain-containing protein [Chitinophagaceae bacterium]